MRNMISETLSLTETTIMTEEENLDELSMKTLGSYTKKSFQTVEFSLNDHGQTGQEYRWYITKMNEDHHEKDFNGDPIPHDDPEEKKKL